MKLKSFLLGVSLAAVSAFAATAETWKLAVTDVEGMERLQLEWGPFKEALETATGDTFEFYAVNSRTAAAEALRGETVDFVVSGPAEYVVINKLTNATPLIGLGRPDYHCAIIVRADSGINVPADLKGKKVAFGDIGSTSNMLCPMQVLADHGRDRGEAARLADAYDARLRDFTSFRPTPKDGTVEIWLSGNGAQAAARVACGRASR